MADLENVLNGLQTCVDGECEKCPYGGTCSDAEDFVALARDALELLKAYQPRVLTVEEVKASKGKDVCLEYFYYPFEGKTTMVAATISEVSTKSVEVWGTPFAFACAGYNKQLCCGWRCWNVRPTDAERQAVKWE